MDNHQDIKVGDLVVREGGEKFSSGEYDGWVSHVWEDIIEVDGREVWHRSKLRLAYRPGGDRQGGVETVRVSAGMEPSPHKNLPEDDAVTRPAHYADAVLEPILFAMLNDLPGWAFNVVKYTFRAGKKLYDGRDAKQSELTDLRKAARYIELRIRQIEDREELENLSRKLGHLFTTQ